MATVSVHSTHKYQQAIHARHHQLSADESAALGGDDQGPNPYELLLSSLGACTSITLRMYAERKGWSLGEIHVDLRFYRDEEGGEHIERTLHCSGELEVAQQERLLEIAARTPVTRTLLQGTAVATQWK